MKNEETQLASIAEALLALAKQVEQLAADMEAPKLDKKAKPAKKTPAKKTTAKKAKPASKKKAAPAKKAPKTKEKPQTVLEQVEDVISRSRKGASIDKLKEKTGLAPRQLSNALYKLTKKGLIEARSRGVYFKKK